MVIFRKAEQKDIKSKKYNIFRLRADDDHKVGLAVDIGTTTLSLTLMINDCGNIYEIDKISQKNNQVALGKDVIMRLMHAQNGLGTKLSTLIRNQIENSAIKMLSEHFDKIPPIDEMTIVGNTTMCHFFLGQDTSGLSKAPFKPSYFGSFTTSGAGVDMHSPYLSSTTIKVLPGLDAHVGADAIAFLGISLWDDMTGEFKIKDKTSLYMDIGTNAEIILYDKGDIYATSAAAGPAFESGGAKSGMIAGESVITHVKISKNTHNTILDILTDKEENDISTPRGICGSGILDAIAQLLKNNIIDETGYLLENQTDERSGEKIYKLCENIYITQTDIREILLATSAIKTSLEILLSRQGINSEDVDEIVISGVFGGSLKKETLYKTGLIPYESFKKADIIFAGNAAGEGCCKALWNDKFLKGLEDLSKSITHISLAEDEKFNELFIKNCRF